MILLEGSSFESWNFSTREVIKALTAEEYDSLIKIQNIHQYSKGQFIFQKGRTADGVYLIENGAVKKYKEVGLGKEQILYIATKGELLGYHTILSGKDFPDSAVALENSKITFIPKESFKNVMNNSTLFRDAFMKMLGDELNVVGNFASLGKSGHPEERLARILVVLHYKFQQAYADVEEVMINISRKDLANLINMAEENVTRILKEFKTDHLLETKGSKIWLTDIKKLILLANKTFMNS